MTALAATDATYTIQDQGWGSFGYKNVVKIVFGDGALTYVAGGFPLTKAKMGCPVAIKAFTLMESKVTSGYGVDFDKTTEKLKMFYGNADATEDTVDVELATTVAPAAQEIWATVEGY